MAESENKNKGRKRVSEIKTFPVPFTLEEIQESITVNKPSYQDSKDQLINQAIKLHLTGNIKEAVKSYEHCIKQGFYDHRIFSNYGIIQIPRKEISDEKILEIAVDAGAKDCISLTNFHEITTNKDDFYKVKNKIRQSIENFSYSGIEWRANSFIDISKDDTKEVENMLELFQEDDDIQNVFHNCRFL